MVTLDDDLESSKLASLAINKAVIAAQTTLVATGNPQIKLMKPNFMVMSDEVTEGDLCNKLIGTKGPKATVLLDTTVKPSISGLRSGQLVKKFARSVGLPTVTTTYGDNGHEVLAWDGLTKREKEWLVHVQPPGDTISSMVKDIAGHFNMSTAVVFYDKTFGKTFK